jgi:hypothetical protein
MNVALVCFAREEDNYIEEWTKYHFKIGFDKIIIYQDQWECKLNDPKIVKISSTYGKDPNRLVGFYNHFIESMSSSFDHAAFFDVDEFLVLKKHNNVKNFLKSYLECQSIGIPWVYFGDNGLSSVEDNDYSVIKRFTKRRKRIGWGHGLPVKQILKLDKKIQMSIHHPFCEWHSQNKIINTGPGLLTEEPTDIAQLNHYYCKTKQEFVEKKMNLNVHDWPVGLGNFNNFNFNEIEDLAAYNFYFDKSITHP